MKVVNWIRFNLQMCLHQGFWILEFANVSIQKISLTAPDSGIHWAGGGVKNGAVCQPGIIHLFWADFGASALHFTIIDNVLCSLWLTAAT